MIDSSGTTLYAGFSYVGHGMLGYTRLTDRDYPIWDINKFRWDKSRPDSLGK
jgi:hypothetical protein